MRTVTQLLSELRARHVRLWADGDRLRYAAPVALPPELLSELQAHKAALLDYCHEAGWSASETPVLARADRAQPVPLSSAQHRLWFLDQLQGGSAHYNEFAAQRITGPLQVERLERAFGELVRRHEILRTTFALSGDAPVQQIASEIAVPFAVEDFSHLPPAEREAAVLRRAQAEAAMPFDLQRGPVWRILLLRLAPDDHVLCANFHHILCDNWSTSIVIRELTALYAALDALPTLPAQYADYAVWQQAQLRSPRAQADLEYWRKQLADAPALLELPLDHPRPPAQTFNGDSLFFTLPAELTRQLKTLSQNANATLFMTLLAAYAVVLSRYARQSEVVIGSPIANRHLRETEAMLGLFLNLLALRVNLAENPPFLELLARVRQTALDAYAHQTLAFENIVEALQPARALSHSPIFQTLFVLHNAPRETLNVSGLTFTPFSVPTGVTKFDLNLLLEERVGELHAQLDYNTDLWDAATAHRFVGHFTTLLNGIAADPHLPIGRINLLTDAERAQLGGWNDTARPYNLDQLLPQLFEAQAARTPEAPAVTFDGQTLTYAELNQRTTRLAEILAARGVKPNTLVGVGLERSLEMVIALYAILKAGGAYLPLDPTLPTERLAFMARDAQVPLILTQSHWARQFAEFPTLALDALWPAERGAVISASPTDLAYCIYTSGSTGQPKGALNAHRGIVNRLLWMNEHYPLAADDVVLQKTPFSFDVSVWEFFWPLFTGARLVVAKPEGHKDAAYLIELIQRADVTTVHFVPSMLQAFITAPGVEQCTSLRRIICSGEALPYELCERVWAKLPRVELHNLYGPTEAAVDVTYWHCQPNPRRVVPIGRPVANTQLYILDEHLQSVPLSIPGELYIGGVQVGMGYLNRPELTAEKFITTPQSRHLYKTGDLARYLPDGNIEYLGRLDFQVKLHGFRIELGEIEGRLTEHPAVREALVTLYGQGDERRLVTYLVLNNPLPHLAEQLREYLAPRLPDYMLPAHFIVLEAFPLSANGKINRRALPTPDLTARAPYVAPRTPLEETVAAVWSEILRREKIGVHDNFFDLGGHSLRATQVAARLHVPVRAVFEHPTLAAFAAHLTSTSRLELPPISFDPTLTTAPLSYAQQRLWILDQFPEYKVAYNIPLLFIVRGALNVAALEWALAALIEKYPSLRTTFRVVDNAPVQTIASSVPSAVLMKKEMGAESLLALAQAEALRPFDLQHGPLYRFTLVPLGDNEQALFFVFHHIITDGWSINLFLRDLNALYSGEASLATGNNYLSYALWQRHHLTDAALEPHLAYWRQQLADALSLATLPLDRPRPPQLTANGRMTYFELSPELTHQLRALSQTHGVTLYMTLLTGLAIVLARYNRLEEVVIGSGIANRPRPELETIFGFFVNTLALRLDLSDQPTGRDLLARVRQVALDAYAHQDLPFEKLVDALQPERAPGQTPFFQVMFALQNMPHKTAQLADLAIEPLRLERTASKFDLTLLMDESDEALTATVEYNADLFNPDTVARFIGHFRTVLAALAAAPETSVTQLDLLTLVERQQLLVAWNDTSTPYPRDLTVAQCFEAQAARTPEALAVIYGEQNLTYRQLEERANQLAHYLRAQLPPGTAPALIGLYLPASPDLIVAMLAILKAGAAYLPLDLAYPLERLAYMLQDATVPVVLSHTALQTQLPSHVTHVICLDAVAPTLATYPVTAPVVALTPDALAYSMYTSGSTGQPKGILIPHRGITRLVLNTNYITLTPHDRVAQASNTSFDAATFEIWGALLNGATVIGLPKETLLAPSALAQFIRAHGLTTLFLTTALFNQIASAMPTALQPLRTVLFGGEAVDPQWVAAVLQAGPPERLLHVYGPTENTTFSSWHPVIAVTPTATTIPIGRPIANSQIYILDPHLQPVPVGVTGELFTGGDGLALGYLNRPELTAEKFINTKYGRLYRTGDAVRYLPSGAIEFIGRFDHQIKLRGFRIELGEIETALRQHSSLKDSVVLVKGDGNARHLVAYVIPTNGTLETARLREYLAARLPDYMLPSTFVVLEAFPLNANGKVDRARLPEPELAAPVAYIEPHTETETRLAAVWRDLLQQPAISVDANFFELGGHSLLATQMAARLPAEFGVEVALSAVFEHATLSALAEHIEALRATLAEEEQGAL